MKGRCHKSQPYWNMNGFDALYFGGLDDCFFPSLLSGRKDKFRAMGKKLPKRSCTSYTFVRGGLLFKNTVQGVRFINAWFASFLARGSVVLQKPLCHFEEARENRNTSSFLFHHKVCVSNWYGTGTWCRLVCQLNSVTKWDPRREEQKKNRRRRRNIVCCSWYYYLINTYLIPAGNKILNTCY